MFVIDGLRVGFGPKVIEFQGKGYSEHQNFLP